MGEALHLLVQDTACIANLRAHEGSPSTQLGAVVIGRNEGERLSAAWRRCRACRGRGVR